MKEPITVDLCATYRVINGETYIRANDLIKFFDDSSTAVATEDTDVWFALMTILGMLIRLDKEARHGS